MPKTFADDFSEEDIENPVLSFSFAGQKVLTKIRKVCYFNNWCIPYEDYFYVQKLNLSADGGQNTAIGMYMHTITSILCYKY